MLARHSSCGSSDPVTPSPLRARASVDIYNLYGVPMPPFIDVASSPENVLSQPAPESPPYVEEKDSEDSLKQFEALGAPVYVPKQERRNRLQKKTSFGEQGQIVATSDPATTEENLQPKQKPTAASSHQDYVDLIRKVDLEVKRTYKDGSTQIVKLTEGPSGFCVAMMKEGMVTTEIPSLALVPVKKVINPVQTKTFRKKPAAWSKKKRTPATKVDCILCCHSYVYIYIYTYIFIYRHT